MRVFDVLFKELFKLILLFVVKRVRTCDAFIYKCVHTAGVYAAPLDVSFFGLEMLDKVRVDGSIHREDVIVTLMRLLNKTVLMVWGSGVEKDELFVFVGLLLGDFFSVVFEGKVVALGALKKTNRKCFFVELLVATESILDEEAKVGPFFFVCFVVFFEEVCQFVSYFFGDVTVDFFDACITL